MVEGRLLVFLTAMLVYIVLVLVLTLLIPKMLDKPLKKMNLMKNVKNKCYCSFSKYLFFRLKYKQLGIYYIIMLN